MIDMVYYKFTLPYPPSVNGYWRTFRNRQIISKRGRKYRIDAVNEIKALNLDDINIDSELVFKMTINPPTLRSYDVDNFTKGVFDALSHAKFWVDDSQVKKLVIIKGVKTKFGNVEIEVNNVKS